MRPIKGAVITSGKDSFSGGADLTMLQRHADGLRRREGARIPTKATKMLFDDAGRMSWSVPQARDLRQAVGLGDQRHLHGRRLRAVARLPRPRRRR